MELRTADPDARRPVNGIRRIGSYLAFEAERYLHDGSEQLPVVIGIADLVGQIPPVEHFVKRSVPVCRTDNNVCGNQAAVFEFKACRSIVFDPNPDDFFTQAQPSTEGFEAFGHTHGEWQGASNGVSRIFLAKPGQHEQKSQSRKTGFPIRTFKKMLQARVFNAFTFKIGRAIHFSVLHHKPERRALMPQSFQILKRIAQPGRIHERIELITLAHFGAHMCNGTCIFRCDFLQIGLPAVNVGVQV